MHPPNQDQDHWYAQQPPTIIPRPIAPSTPPLPAAPVAHVTPKRLPSLGGRLAAVTGILLLLVLALGGTGSAAFVAVRSSDAGHGSQIRELQQEVASQQKALVLAEQNGARQFREEGRKISNLEAELAYYRQFGQSCTLGGGSEYWLPCSNHAPKPAGS